MPPLTKILYMLVCDTCGRVDAGHWEKPCQEPDSSVVCRGTLRTVPQDQKVKN